MAEQALIALMNRHLLILVTLQAVICCLIAGCHKQQPVANSLQGSGTEVDETHLTLHELENRRPVEVRADGYGSSKSCRECHEHNHQTWWASYHRTMTQVATPANVIGDLDDVPFEVAGRSYRLFKRDRTCWIETDNPDAATTGVDRITRPVVMTTGSHHMQLYWYATGTARELGQLPLAYLKETGRWVPRDAAFLKPPDAPFVSETGRWNETCSACHSTHPRSRPDETRSKWDTLVAEFGIACEACHGPGQRHVRLHQSLRGKRTEHAKDPIVNPAQLPHRRATQVCGQCHSITTSPNPQEYKNVLMNGYHYRPGEELSKSMVVVRDNEQTRELLNYRPKEDVESYLANSFWPDGMVRVTGREYNGLLETGCFQRGELSCLSCHALHQSPEDSRTASDWADDQLGVDMRGDRACLQCHESHRFGQRHTHHAAGSSGSRCYNCHMPHTTYGLLKAVRSHQITSPNIDRSLQAARPNACNLCHLDKTLAWSAQYTEAWFGHKPPDLGDDQREIASSLLWLLRGDAAQRALAAWSMGWEPALEASGDAWQAPFLAQLLEDPYAAVRFIAARSLKGGKSFSELEYNFVDSPKHRRAAREDVWDAWHLNTTGSPQPSPILIDAEGRVREDLLQRLLNERDNRPVQLAE